MTLKIQAEIAEAPAIPRNNEVETYSNKFLYQENTPAAPCSTAHRERAAAAAVREGGSAPLARALTARMEHAVAEAVRTHDLALKMYGAARVGSCEQN